MKARLKNHQSRAEEGQVALILATANLIYSINSSKIVNLIIFHKIRQKVYQNLPKYLRKVKKKIQIIKLLRKIKIESKQRKRKV